MPPRHGVFGAKEKSNTELRCVRRASSRVLAKSSKEHREREPRRRPPPMEEREAQQWPWLKMLLSSGDASACLSLCGNHADSLPSSGAMVECSVRAKEV